MMLDDRKLFSSISEAGTLKSASTVLVSSGSEDEFPLFPLGFCLLPAMFGIPLHEDALTPSSVSTIGGALPLIVSFWVSYRKHP